MAFCTLFVAHLLLNNFKQQVSNKIEKMHMLQYSDACCTILHHKGEIVNDR
jgi:hypothetical protein